MSSGHLPLWHSPVAQAHGRHRLVLGFPIGGAALVRSPFPVQTQLQLRLSLPILSVARVHSRASTISLGVLALLIHPHRFVFFRQQIPQEMVHDDLSTMLVAVC